MVMFVCSVLDLFLQVLPKKSILHFDIPDVIEKWRNRLRRKSVKNSVFYFILFYFDTRLLLMCDFLIEMSSSNFQYYWTTEYLKYLITVLFILSFY